MRACRYAVVLLFLLFIARAHADEATTADTAFHPAVAGGVGHAYGVIGVHAELRQGSWAIMGGTGLLFTPVPFFVVGGRWTSAGESGLAISLHADLNPPGDYAGVSQALLVIAGTVGYRWNLNGFFAEAAIGPAVSIERRVNEGSDPESGPFGVPIYLFGFGAFGANALPVPDIGLSMGYQW